MADSKPPSKPRTKPRTKPEEREEGPRSRRVPIYSTPRESEDLQELTPDTLLSTVVALAHALEGPWDETSKPLPKRSAASNEGRARLERASGEAPEAVVVSLREFVAKKPRR